MTHQTPTISKKQMQTRRAKIIPNNAHRQLHAMHNTTSNKFSSNCMINYLVVVVVVFMMTLPLATDPAPCPGLLLPSAY
jgi:hypothetical protein